MSKSNTRPNSANIKTNVKVSLRHRRDTDINLIKFENLNENDKSINGDKIANKFMNISLTTNLPNSPNPVFPNSSRKASENLPQNMNLDKNNNFTRSHNSGTNLNTLQKKRYAKTLNQIHPRNIKHLMVDSFADVEKVYDIDSVPIGKGSYGTVYKCKERKDSSKCWAIKKLPKNKNDRTSLKLLEREVSILKRISHPNIIHLEAIYETSESMFLITELCEHGELKKYMQHKRLQEEEVRLLIEQLSSALTYLHKLGVVHRDIKLENILISNTDLKDTNKKTSIKIEECSSKPTKQSEEETGGLIFTNLSKTKIDKKPIPEQTTPNTKTNSQTQKLSIKLTDFGLSVVRGGVSSDSMVMSFCGTPVYMAPEIIQNHDYSQTCDIWSMGVITYTMIAGKYPWTIPVAGCEDHLYKQIKKGEVHYDDNLFSKKSQEIISGMLRVDTATRLTAAEVLDHPWTKGQTHLSAPKTAFEMMKEARANRLTTTSSISSEGSFDSRSGSRCASRNK